jgi:type I restriction enzyme S subunit
LYICRTTPECHLPYLYCALQAACLERIDEGSVIPSLTALTLSALTIPLPPLGEQKAFAEAVLGLEAVGELAARQNETLLAMADAAFKEIFLGEAGRGLEQVPLSRFGKIRVGYTPKQSFAIISEGVGLPFVTAEDMRGQPFILETKRGISKVGDFKVLRALLPGTVCVSCTATVGLVSILCKRCRVNQQICSISPWDQRHGHYLFSLLRNIASEIKDMAEGGGTCFPYLQRKYLAEIHVPWPNDEKLEKFENSVLPLFCKIEHKIKARVTTKKIKNLIISRIASDIRL